MDRDQITDRGCTTPEEWVLKAQPRVRKLSFGQTWADVMEFALLIQSGTGNARLHTKWEDPSPMSDREVLENIMLRRSIGISAEQALSEAGYGENDIKRMLG